MNVKHVVRCDICKINMSPSDMPSHFKGKRHKKAEKARNPEAAQTHLQEENVNSAKQKCNICNVFVPLGCMDSHINGKVHKSLLIRKSGEANDNTAGPSNSTLNVKLRSIDPPINKQNKEMCEVCGILVDNATMQSHTMGKKHQAKLKKLEEAKKKNNSTIKVTGCPSNITNGTLLEYFQQFGSFRMHYIKDNSLFIHYNKPFMAEQALSINHYFQNQLLTVTRPTLEVIQKNPEQELDLTAIANSLKEAGDVNQQLAIFMNSVRPEFPANIEKYKQICFDLEMTLRKVFSHCRIHAFGSTVTGLCFKNSDVDIYVELPAAFVRNCDSDYLLKRSRSALFTKKEIFNDIICIFTAKIPIVKCLHMPTKIKCDFNFKSWLGVCNSHLIAYYISLDPKITQMILILKFWAQIHEISGSPKFTNYALTMLVIFYLQHPPFNLPPVIALQNNVPMNQGEWSGGFVPIRNFQSDALRNSSLLELLKGFFHFYLTFDFGLYVISPFIGTELPKINFFEPINLPNELNRYKTYLSIVPEATPLDVECTVCVQDPFELTRNICGVVSDKICEWFLNCCKTSYLLLRDNGENNMLYNLFTLSPRINKEVTNFHIRLTGNVKYIYETIEPSNRTINTLRNVWFENVNTFLLSLLEFVLKLNVEIHSPAPTNKLQRLELQDDVYGNIVDTIVFHCTGKYNLWEYRKSWLKKFISEAPPPPPCATKLDKEVALTNFVLDHDELIVPERPSDFNLVVTAKTNPTLVEFEFKRISGDKNTFHKLYVFFITNFSECFMSSLNKNPNIIEADDLP